jgi:hypothetical protein
LKKKKRRRECGCKESSKSVTSDAARSRARKIIPLAAVAARPGLRSLAWRRASATGRSAACASCVQAGPGVLVLFLRPRCRALRRRFLRRFQCRCEAHFASSSRRRALAARVRSVFFAPLSRGLRVRASRPVRPCTAHASHRSWAVSGELVVETSASNRTLMRSHLTGECAVCERRQRIHRAFCRG